ncbi:MAG: 3'-5' exonuclease [Bacteroidales bacterium]
MKTTITKEEIAQLPVVLFEGRIITLDSMSDLESAVAYLSAQPMIGIDTETRPAFKKGVVYNVSLLQISTLDTCFLFRLNRIGFPSSLIDLFESKSVKKIGLSLQDDFGKLKKMGSFKEQSVVELQQFVKKYQIEDISLQKVYALLFDQKISKSQRLTNWDTDVLTEQQKRYAATDAWACLRIYNELLNNHNPLV